MYKYIYKYVQEQSNNGKRKCKIQSDKIISYNKNNNKNIAINING